MQGLGWLAAIIVGGLAGWIGSSIMKADTGIFMNIILGIVGAGGIGFYIQTYVRSFQYDKAASVTIAVVVMVMAIEAINVALRRRFT